MLSYSVAKKKNKTDFNNSNPGIFLKKDEKLENLAEAKILQNSSRTDALEDLIKKISTNFITIKNNTIESPSISENLSTDPSRETSVIVENINIRNQISKKSKKKIKKTENKPKEDMTEKISKIKNFVPTGFDLIFINPDIYSFFRCISHKLFNDKNNYNSILHKATAFIRNHPLLFKNIIFNMQDFLSKISINKFEDPIFLSAALSYKFNLFIYEFNEKKFLTFNLNNKNDNEIFLLNYCENFYLLEKTGDFQPEPMKFVLFKPIQQIEPEIESEEEIEIPVTKNLDIFPSVVENSPNKQKQKRKNKNPVASKTFIAENKEMVKDSQNKENDSKKSDHRKMNSIEKISLFIEDPGKPLNQNVSSVSNRTDYVDYQNERFDVYPPIEETNEYINNYNNRPYRQRNNRNRRGYYRNNYRNSNSYFRNQSSNYFQYQPQIIFYPVFPVDFPFELFYNFQYYFYPFHQNDTIPGIRKELTKFYRHNDEVEPYMVPVKITVPPRYETNESLEERIELYREIEEDKKNNS